MSRLRWYFQLIYDITYIIRKNNVCSENQSVFPVDKEDNMKKWLIIVSVVIVIAAASAAIIYLNAVEPVKKAEETAVQIAMEETDITKVNEFSLYHGEQTYFIIQGENKKGTKLIAWIPEKKGKIMVKKSSNGLSREEAVNKVLAEISSAEIISVRLGMENGIPLWEIHSRTKENLLNYHSIVFETGEWLKKIENL